jgi:general secretion pathway protein J
MPRARHRHRRRIARARGMTLLEILVSIVILAMISLLIYGAFDSMSRGKKGEERRSERARQGRDAVQRMARDISSAFLSMHNPQNIALATRTTAFIASSGAPFDRLDFSAFAHKRVDKEAKESDQCELGFSVARDPDVVDKMDLVRREQYPIDMDPKRGGVINVLAEDVELFDVRFLDPLTGQWKETWDTTQALGELNRLPLEVKITLSLKNVPIGTPSTFTTKFIMPMQQPLSFGIAR